jgi:peptide deformylase
MKIITDIKHLNKVCEKINLHESLAIGKKMLVWLMSHKNIAKNTLGLACNQLGLDGRIILVKNKGKFFIYINPRIVWMSDDLITTKEQCLSVPNQEIEVSRSRRIRVMDDYQCCGAVPMSGQEAIVIQHEIDHLNGIIITDKDDIETEKFIEDNYKLNKWSE